jgi:hypothetical protein
MKNSDILRAVKPLIERQDFICTRLAHVPGITAGERWSLVQWIRGLIGPGATTLERWLELNGHFAAEEAYHEQWCKEKMYVTRQAWLDWMIAYWEAEEAKAVLAGYQYG